MSRGRCIQFWLFNVSEQSTIQMLTFWTFSNFCFICWMILFLRTLIWGAYNWLCISYLADSCCHFPCISELLLLLLSSIRLTLLVVAAPCYVAGLKWSCVDDTWQNVSRIHSDKICGNVKPYSVAVAAASLPVIY